MTEQDERPRRTRQRRPENGWPGAEGRTWRYKRDADLDLRPASRGTASHGDRGGHLPFPQTPAPASGPRRPHRGSGQLPGRGRPLRLPDANFRDARGIVMLEFIVALVIIALRAVSDYRPAADQSQPGSEKPLKGLGPLPLTAATCFSWFILSAVAQKRGWTSYFAASFGALMLLVLLMNSSGELGSVATWIDDLGGWSPAASKAQTATPVTGPAATAPASAPPASPEQNNPPGWKTIPGTFGSEVYPVGGKCPSGWELTSDKTRCVAPLASNQPQM